MAETGKGKRFLDRFAEVSAKVGNQIHMRTLRDAFATITPLYILAGLAVLVSQVVMPLVLSGDALTTAQVWGSAITLGTLNFTAVILAGVLGYCLAANKRFDNAIACVIVGISAFVVMMPQTIVATVGNAVYATSATDKTAAALSYPIESLSGSLGAPSGYALTGVDATGAFDVTHTGANGLFGAIVVALLAVSLFIKLSSFERLKVDLGEGVPPAVADSFNVMFPMLLSLATFGLAAAVLAAFGTDLLTLISALITAPLKDLMNAGPWAVIVIYTLANLLFCLGIHQATISGVLAEPILTMLIIDNMATFASAQPIPQDHYMNMQIINTFALIGGSGCTLALLLDTFLFSKSKSSREIAVLSILPGAFNINEPVIYGYPVVFNLPLMIPFVIVPDLLIAATYGLTCAGVIAPCVVQVHWTTPPVLSGLLATAGDWRAAVWQVIEIAIAMAIYLPFIKVSEAQSRSDEA
ncbi:PTS sugar transporter subunit IIC [Olsenella intestinalis]|uniref:PTS sugar transporter subunit IIC n=1 Tax=Olsenella intestinalis TaxID=2930083 RepID=UPI002010556C|nr:PTS transporter subunit EIIC [Olsenella intestinalis]